MNYIFSIASFCSFFFAVLLLKKKTKALHDRVLLYWLIYLGLFTGLYLISDFDFFIRFKLFPVFVISLFLLHGPFLFLYTSALTLGKKGLQRRDFLHFVPFLTFAVYLFIASLFPDYAAKISMDHVSSHVQPPLFFILLLLATAFSGPVYFILCIKEVQKHKSNYPNNFSSIENINLDWLRILLYIFGAVWSVLIIIAVIHHVFHYSSMYFCINGLLLSLSAFIVLLGYYGLRQQEIFTHFPIEDYRHAFLQDEPEGAKVKYANLSLSEDEITSYSERIDCYMKEEKPYLNPDLTLPQLALELNTSTHQLSRIINEHYGRNFYDFINGYRIEEVKDKLFDPDFYNFSLLGIAFESGFNSKSAFNRTFKKATGLTPSEYKKTQSRPSNKDGR